MRKPGINRPVLQPATEYDVQRVSEAIEHLRKARDLLKAAGCPETVKRVRLALTSAGGAQRHVSRREMASYHESRRQWDAIEDRMAGFVITKAEGQANA